MKTHENGSAREGYSDLKSEGILLNFLKRMSLNSSDILIAIVGILCLKPLLFKSFANLYFRFIRSNET